MATIINSQHLPQCAQVYRSFEQIASVARNTGESPVPGHVLAYAEDPALKRPEELNI